MMLHWHCSSELQTQLSFCLTHTSEVFNDRNELHQHIANEIAEEIELNNANKKLTKVLKEHT